MPASGAIAPRAACPDARALSPWRRAVAVGGKRARHGRRGGVSPGLSRVLVVVPEIFEVQAEAVVAVSSRPLAVSRAFTRVTTSSPRRRPAGARRRHCRCHCRPPRRTDRRSQSKSAPHAATRVHGDNVNPGGSVDLHVARRGRGRAWVADTRCHSERGAPPRCRSARAPSAAAPCPLFRKLVAPVDNDRRMAPGASRELGAVSPPRAAPFAAHRRTCHLWVARPTARPPFSFLCFFFCPFCASCRLKRSPFVGFGGLKEKHEDELPPLSSSSVALMAPPSRRRARPRPRA